MNTVPGSLLIVDDEVPFRLPLPELLRTQGYVVTVAADGATALDRLARASFDLMVLDVNMPHMPGMELARHARALQPGAAMCVVTGRGSLESAIEGLHLGALDYMLKTTPPPEICDRLLAALARHRKEIAQQALLQNLYTVIESLQKSFHLAPPAPPAEQWIEIDKLHISLWRQLARCGDQTLHLTPIEFRMLGCLAQQVGQVLTYQDLLRGAQGYDAEPGAAAVLVKPHIYHLRQKIETDPSHPQHILTVRGIGYMLSPGAAAG